MKEKMNFKNPSIQKLISCLIILGTLLPVLFILMRPEKANAIAGAGDTVFDFPSEFAGIATSATSSTGAAAGTASAGSNAVTAATQTKTWYQTILEQVLKAVARKVLQELTKSVVSWVNNGFHGSPLFLQNAGSFFTDIVKSEVKTIVDQYGYDSRKFPFGKDFALNTINSYRGRNNPTGNTQYTLSTIITDPIALSNYQNNFNVGGWNGFLINTQYPQNNYLGFQMLANEDLARKISSTGNVNNKITQYQQMLQQGQGFLSPQTCPTNDKYNNGANEFQRPVFDNAGYDTSFRDSNPYPQPVNSESPTTAEQDATKKWESDYQSGLATKKTDWAKNNTCPGGLQTTTPGYVVGTQVAKALGATQDQTLVEIGAGDAISSILGAVLDHFLNEGLTALASKVNKPPSADTWTYGGQSLDGTGGANTNPFDGFDEVVSLKDFKKLLNGYFIGTCTLPVANFSDTPEKQKDISETDCKKTQGVWVKNQPPNDYIPGDIANTDTEIHLMDSPPCNPNDATCISSAPGIIQKIGEIWSKTRTLDQCLPGPDKNWESRLKDEQNRITQKVEQGQSGRDDNLKTRAAADIVRELKFAVDSFKDWVNTKMIQELPGAILYMDEVNKINDFPDKLKQVTDTRRAKSSTLARLKAINQGLDDIGKAIAPADEPDHKKNPAEEAKMIAFKKQYNSLKPSISSVNTLENSRNELLTLTEASAKLEEPVNPKDLTKGTKGLIPQCLNERKNAGWGPIDIKGTGKSMQNGITEIYKFCGDTSVYQQPRGPIASGYSHGEVIRRDSTNGGDPDNPPEPPGANFNFTFRNQNGNDNGSPGYTTLPMIDASWVLGDFICTGACSLAKASPVLPGAPGWRHLQDDQRISVDIDCSTIFKANITDYTHAGDLAF